MAEKNNPKTVKLIIKTANRWTASAKVGDIITVGEELANFLLINRYAAKPETRKEG